MRHDKNNVCVGRKRALRARVDCSVGCIIIFSFPSDENIKTMKLVKQRREGKNGYYLLDDEPVLHILKIAV